MDRLRSLSGRGDARSWWGPWAHVVPDWLKTFVGLEGLAESEFVYEPLVAGGTGQFYVLDFAQARSVDYTELLDGAVYVQDPDDVRTYTPAAQNLRHVALDPDESLAHVKALL